MVSGRRSEDLREMAIVSRRVIEAVVRQVKELSHVQASSFCCRSHYQSHMDLFRPGHADDSHLAKQVSQE